MLSEFIRRPLVALTEESPPGGITRPMVTVTMVTVSSSPQTDRLESCVCGGMAGEDQLRARYSTVITVAMVTVLDFKHIKLKSRSSNDGS